MGQTISRSYRPNKIRIQRRDYTLILKSLTMIDLATWWFEVVQYKNKKSATIANVVEKKWLCRYPYATIITSDRGN